MDCLIPNFIEDIKVFIVVKIKEIDTSFAKEVNLNLAWSEPSIKEVIAMLITQELTTNFAKELVPNSIAMLVECSFTKEMVKPSFIIMVGADITFMEEIKVFVDIILYWEPLPQLFQKDSRIYLTLLFLIIFLLLTLFSFLASFTQLPFIVLINMPISLLNLHQVFQKVEVIIPLEKILMVHYLVFIQVFDIVLIQIKVYNPTQNQMAVDTPIKSQEILVFIQASKSLKLSKTKEAEDFRYEEEVSS